MEIASSSVIVLDSSDDENTTKSTEDGIETKKNEVKATKTQQTIKRIAPQLLSTEVSRDLKRTKFGVDSEDIHNKKPSPKKQNSGSSINSFKKTRLLKLCEKNDVFLLDDNSEDDLAAVDPSSVKEEQMTSSSEKAPINPAFLKLIDTSRNIDRSSDMEKLINKKLIVYYHAVHPDFVNSKSFCRAVSSITNEIQKNPELIYLKLSNILQELKTRRKANDIVVKNEESKGTGSTRKDAQIWKLNKALYVLKKRIAKLEEAEVNFDDDINSAHLKAERYKKRACQIYEKICDISGESKHAQRSVRKPIKFNGTSFPEFNKTLQAFVNRTNTFPDYFDVQKCLEHCNSKYSMQLMAEEIKRIAQDAFIKVGKLLQKRRKTDLYETVSYFVGTEKDPADEDSELQEKLSRNKKYHTKISDLIEKFAKDQDSASKDEGESSSVHRNGNSSSPMCSIKIECEEVDETPIEDQIASVPIVDHQNGNSSTTTNESAHNLDLMTTMDGEKLDESKEPVETTLEENENLETVNMDDTIEFVVSNNLDAFEDVSLILSEHDDLNLDL